MQPQARGQLPICKSPAIIIIMITRIILTDNLEAEDEMCVIADSTRSRKARPPWSCEGRCSCATRSGRALRVATAVAARQASTHDLSRQAPLSLSLPLPLPLPLPGPAAGSSAAPSCFPLVSSHSASSQPASASRQAFSFSGPSANTI